MKNLKCVFFIFVILIVGNALQAQSANESSKLYSKQVGFNFTDFALRFLSFNESTGGTPSILLLYKKGNNEKKWRFGFGGNLNWRKRNSNSSSSNFVNFNFNFGREYHHPITKKWLTYFGWETIWRASYSSTSFSNNIPPQKNTLKRGRIGGQGLVGIQFNFNDRLSLMTETSYGLIFTYTKDENKNESYFLSSNYSPPVSLILNYHF